MEAGYWGEEHPAISVFRPPVGEEGDVMRSVAVVAHQMGDQGVTVEGDQVLPRRGSQVSLPSFAGVTGMGNVAGEGVLVPRFPWGSLAQE